MTLSLAAHGAPDSRNRLVSYLKLDDDPDSIVSTILVELAADIIEGRVAPGQSVNSLELARRFETSRTPIREALIALEREGLLEIERGKRPRVPKPGDEQLDEVYTLRAELNAMVAVKVVRRMDDTDLERLRSSLAVMQGMSDAGDVDGFFWGNVDYHELCEDIAGDGTLKRVLSSLGLPILRLRHEGMTRPGRMERSMEDHKRLTLAFAERDEVLASALSRTLVLGGLYAIRRGESAESPGEA